MLLSIAKQWKKWLSIHTTILSEEKTRIRCGYAQRRCFWKMSLLMEKKYQDLGMWDSNIGRENLVALNLFHFFLLPLSKLLPHFFLLISQMRTHPFHTFFFRFFLL